MALIQYGVCPHKRLGHKHTAIVWRLEQNFHLQAKKRHSEETNLADTQISDFQNCEKINFFCLSHPVCSTLR
jgi:hypothetical protein